MATSALHALWVEPRPTNAPDPGPRDWALVAALVGWSLVEVVLRRDLAPGPVLLLYALAVIGPLPWRRTHPLVAVAVSFGTLMIVDLVRILTGPHGAPLNSTSAALILTYALFTQNFPEPAQDAAGRHAQEAYLAGNYFVTWTSWMGPASRPGTTSRCAGFRWEPSPTSP